MASGQTDTSRQFMDGASAAFKALRDVYNMDANMRNFLFGKRAIFEIFLHMTPNEVFTILGNKDKLWAQHVELGDVIESEAENEYLVTYVDSDQKHFDCIGLGDGYRGRTLSNMTLEKMGAKVSGETYPFYKGTCTPIDLCREDYLPAK